MRRQISIYVLSVVCLAAVMGYVFLDRSRTLAALEADKAQKKKDLAVYAETNKRIAEIKKKIAEIQSKLDVIRGLEAKKTGPVRLLDEIAMAIPKDKLWLRSLDEKKGVLTLNGTAMDNDTVAVFMTNLEKAAHITSVDLQSTKLKSISAHKLNVTDFIVNCKLYSYSEKPETETKKGS